MFFQFAKQSKAFLMVFRPWLLLVCAWAWRTCWVRQAGGHSILRSNFRSSRRSGDEPDPRRGWHWLPSVQCGARHWLWLQPAGVPRHLYRHTGRLSGREFIQTLREAFQSKNQRNLGISPKWRWSPPPRGVGTFLNLGLFWNGLTPP